MCRALKGVWVISLECLSSASSAMFSLMFSHATHPGVLTVRGKHVADARAKRPVSSTGQVSGQDDCVSNDRTAILQFRKGWGAHNVSNCVLPHLN